MSARDYQFETSPRKYEPEYESISKKKKSKAKANRNNTKKKKINKKEKSEKEKKKENRKTGLIILANIVFIIGVLFAVIFRNSLITQTFSQIQLLKSDISELQKENDQLEISIQNSLNLNNIEQEAKEKLGMQKLTSKQTIYLNLPKKDYIEPSSEEVIIEEKEGPIKKITNFLKNIF